MLDTPQPHDLMTQLGQRIRAFRKAKQLTRRVLSERSGVSQGYLARLEGGDGNISIGLLAKLAIALNMPVDRFLRDESQQSRDARQIEALYGRADAATRARVLKALDPKHVRAQKAGRLCLVGLRGAGKSTLGAQISAVFDATFVELNDEIAAQSGMPIGEIIALYGQEGYRQLEADTLATITATHSRVVVAVAGGIVSEDETFHHVLSRFHTVWVKTSAGEHMDRVRAQGDVRPMDGNPQAMIQLREILKSREAFYTQADYQLDTSGKRVDVSVSELTELAETNNIFGDQAD